MRTGTRCVPLAKWQPFGQRNKILHKVANLKTKVCIALVLLLPCGVSRASDWVSIAKSANEKTELFIDASSIRIKGDIRLAWTKYEIAPETSSGPLNYADRWTKMAVARSAFNCLDELVRDEALTYYFYDGDNYVTPQSYFPTEWGPVTPDSLREAAWKFVCSWK